MSNTVSNFSPNPTIIQYYPASLFIMSKLEQTPHPTLAYRAKVVNLGRYRRIELTCLFSIALRF